MEGAGGRRLRILARNAVVLGAANLFSRALMVILGILIARWVTEQDYGQFAQAIAWTLVLGYLGNLGLERLITREAARAPAQTISIVWSILVKRNTPAISLHRMQSTIFLPFSPLIGQQYRARRQLLFEATHRQQLS